ncbi:hypothetical protein AL036_08505 [Salipiger aestuarii]|uniref:Uncharacterized protein DUF3775 n=1 Tax=Salipiger aestuarii TaxID=568098 RepID=A0A327Y6E5_9RHOB|nr:DUF3775 domain-containing protein [Salipiger aestuarii]EIE50777.1 hypothetical protein C357_12164 [Citreicella sp. 357]KAA8608001.1 hypothetical protein AL036_08505 [Salipiger aestuarii]KAA8611394.1 hypothetical protein AL037_09435 [Salipiger aestuarii]KAB2542151.1 hypothetical protein AL035_08805 [Salipiger aestuarii]RAK16698.1 uncharacterized protein DUF3775 [Salipiger aestuarii]
MEQISVRKVAHVILMARETRRGEGEMRGLIEHMTEEEQAALVAIMWIGRDAFDAGEWDEAYGTALTEASTPTADYLIGTPHLADHLESGLEALGYDVQDEEDELLRRGA